jgi:molybdenum cofactor biosynthesis protein B
MVEHHRERAREIGRLSFAVLTVSDSKSLEEDASGSEIVRGVEGAGHAVRRRSIVRDEAGAIRSEVAAFLLDPDVQAIVTTGGTGVTSRDVTPEALSPLVEKLLEGFGELLRAASQREVGTAALASRAFAFVARSKPVFCLPGSPRAVALAMRELVLPEAAHLVAELRR